MTQSRSEAPVRARGRRADASGPRAGGPTPPARTVDAAVVGLAAIVVVAVLLGRAGVLNGGALGIDVLLVLAGYVITAALLDEIDRTGRVVLTAFYGRALRVLGPALGVVLVTLCAGGLIVGSETTIGALKAEAVAAVLGASNWYAATTATPIGLVSGSLLQHLWAVALIVQVVAVWPIVVVGCARLGGWGRVRRVARTLALVSAALMVTLALVWGVPGSEATARVAFGTDTRLTGVMLGAALATLRVPRRTMPPLAPGATKAWDVIGGLALAALIGVLIVVPEVSPTAFRGGTALVALLGTAILAALTVPASRLRAVVVNASVLAWLGPRAYALYLWHWPALAVVDDIPVGGAPGVVLAIAAAVVLADLTHRYVERPIRDGAGRLRDRLRSDDAAVAMMVRRRVAVATSAVGVVVALIAAGMAITPAAPVGTAAAAASEDDTGNGDTGNGDAGDGDTGDGGGTALPSVDCAEIKCVALTFDDGPGQHTERLVDILDRLDVTVTFFMLGEQVERLPDVARRVHEAGHEIGTHTYDHDNLRSLDRAAAAKEISAGMTAITEATGVTPDLFRPPYGSSDETIRELAADHGLSEIMWDVDTLDWKDRDSAGVAGRVFGGVTSGSIVLFHDTRPTTVDAIPAIVIGLRMAGYTLVPVGTLLDGLLEPGESFTEGPAPEPTPTPTSTSTSTPDPSPTS